jgi:hypothetical protein
MINLENLSLHYDEELNPSIVFLGPTSNEGFNNSVSGDNNANNSNPDPNNSNNVGHAGNTNNDEDGDAEMGNDPINPGANIGCQNCTAPNIIEANDAYISAREEVKDLANLATNEDVNLLRRGDGYEAKASGDNVIPQEDLNEFASCAKECKELIKDKFERADEAINEASEHNCPDAQAASIQAARTRARVLNLLAEVNKIIDDNTEADDGFEVD